jgi:hypothetical protein
MEKEAINAEMENKALQKELKSNASLCKKLIGKHKLHSEKLSKLKLVKEVSETGELMQKKQILDVKKTKATLQRYLNFFINKIIKIILNLSISFTLTVNVKRSKKII